jgi:hypothetical protein
MDMTPKTYTIHPAAEAYRLMTDDELAALAADIAENGQNDPVIIGKVDGETWESIVDGRNRVKACEIADVLPLYQVRTFKDEDAIRAFVKSRSERRDLSKGERAMGHAMLYPIEATVGGRGNKSDAAKAADTAGFSQRRLREARQVLRNGLELAQRVRDGVVSLDKALAEVTENLKQLETKDQKVARLRAGAPELAESVADDALDLDDAIAALEARERKAEGEKANKRQVQTRWSDALYNGGLTWAVPEFADEVAEHLAADPAYRKEFLDHLRIDPEKLADIKKGADALFKILKLYKDEIK